MGRSKVSAELHEICVKALDMLNLILDSAVHDAENKTFYLKMQGDYHRYAAESAQGDAKLQHAKEANEAYNKGMAEAAALPSIHHVRLGLALNYSVFQHEVLQST